MSVGDVSQLSASAQTARPASTFHLVQNVGESLRMSIKTSLQPQRNATHHYINPNLRGALRTLQWMIERNQSSTSKRKISPEKKKQQQRGEGACFITRYNLDT